MKLIGYGGEQGFKPLYRQKGEKETPAKRLLTQEASSEDNFQLSGKASRLPFRDSRHLCSMHGQVREVLFTLSSSAFWMID